MQIEMALNNIKKSFEDRKDVVKLINEDITNFELIEKRLFNYH